MGLHQLDIYSARELEISEKLIGHDVTREGGQDAEELINRSSPTFAVASIETDEECSYVFQAIKPNGENLTFHVELESGEEAPVSTSSEFERLVFENQKRKVDQPAVHRLQLQQSVVQTCNNGCLKMKILISL